MLPGCLVRSHQVVGSDGISEHLGRSATPNALSHCPPPPRAPTIPPVPSLLSGSFPGRPSRFWGHTPSILFGATESTSIPFPASAGRAAAYSQTSSPPQFKSESHPEGLPCARHRAQVGSKPEPLDFELALRGGRDPVAGSGKPPQELTDTRAEP